MVLSLNEGKLPYVPKHISNARHRGFRDSLNPKLVIEAGDCWGKQLFRELNEITIYGYIISSRVSLS